MTEELTPAQRVKWTEQGLDLPHNFTFEEWSSVGQTLQQLEKVMPWALGDWLMYGERRYGDTYTQAVEETGLSHGHLRNLMWVARKFPKDRRRPQLTHYHHYVCAALSEAEQDMWLDEAVENQWSSKELRTRIRVERLGEDIEVVEPMKEIPAGTYEAVKQLVDAVEADEWDKAKGLAGEVREGMDGSEPEG